MLRAVLEYYMAVISIQTFDTWFALRIVPAALVDFIQLDKSSVRCEATSYFPWRANVQTLAREL